MIGMSQIKKKFFLGLAIGSMFSVIAALIAVLVSINVINGYKNGTSEKFKQLYMTSVCMLSREVYQGEVIADDMVTTVLAHINTVPASALKSSAAAVGQVARYTLPQGIMLTDNMVVPEDEVITDHTIRKQEINTILMPSDLKVGDYIDIRIEFVNGSDYVVLAEKQVLDIQGETMWFDLDENERFILNAAQVDHYMNKGSKLYGTLYSDPSTQIRKLSGEEDKELRGKMTALIDSELSTQEDGVTMTDKVYNFIKKYKNMLALSTTLKTTYAPSETVMKAMDISPNITNEAKAALSREVRANIESINTSFNVDDDLLEEVISSVEESIDNQKELRSGLLEPVESDE